MAESKFIRSMTLAVAAAKATGENVAGALRARADDEDNLVRRGILRLMADKRFLDTVSPVMMWQDDAARALEEFADSLESERRTGFLTKEFVDHGIEDFFVLWSMMMKKNKSFYDASRKARRKAKMEMDAAGRSGEDVEFPGKACESYGRSGKGLDPALMKFLEPGLAEDDDVDDGPSVGDGGDGQRDGENNERQDSESSGQKDGENGRPDGQGAQEGPLRKCSVGGRMRIGSGDPKLEQHRVENIFLRSIPESLRKLAMLVGRAGDNDMSETGRFMNASKNDIEGITVGNNLSSLLPSEVAMLSEKSTQDIFYRNYAGKRLQVFASASQSSHPAVHKDGPVIICVDESSSMSGKPLRTAVTLAYAVTIIARRRHRNVLIVAYSDSHKMMRVESLGRQKKRLLNFLTAISMGGNNENSMFEWLFREVLPDEEKFKTADILCISDFGWVPLTSFVKGLIKEQKAAGMKFYGLNIGGVFGYTDNARQMSSVCDRVWDYYGGRCIEVKR